MTEQKDLKELIREVLLAVHPVGSLFFTSDDRNPDVILFGGGYSKWKRIEGRFIYGASENRPIGQTGGEESHTLTVQEMPRHNHRGIYWSCEHEGGWQVDLNVGTIGYGLSWQGLGGSTTGGGGAGDPNKDLQTASTGGSQAHNNLPPFAVYAIWERIE